ncbi:S8 family serine peptidase [Pseudoneobacillus sp. C159]
MKTKNLRKLFSSLLVLMLALSMYNPVFAASSKDQLSEESVKQMSQIISQQQKAAKKGAVLHKDLQNLTGDEEVAVIVQLSEPPVAMVEGISKLSGKKFTATMEKEAKQKVTAQQQIFEKQMITKGLNAKVGFKYNYAFNGMSLKLKASQVAELMNLKGVQLVEPDEEVHALGKVAPSDTFTPAMNTSAPHLGVPALWAEGIEGQNVKVAVLDTGIDYLHPEFEGVYKGGYNFVTHDAKYARGRDADDPYETTPLDRAAGQPEVNANGNEFWTSHGTHVAGTIAAQGKNTFGIKGLAPKVELYAYRVLGAYGSGATSGIIAGIDKAAAEHMDVMNLSLGGSSTSSTASDSIAINNAALAGTIAVIATGNSGPNRGTIGNPSTAAFSIAVANSTVPADVHSSDIQVTLDGASPTTYSKVELMGTKFGVNPGDTLTGEYDLVAVPKVGATADYNGLDVNGKIALVARGDIAFVEKIAAAKAAGAVGVIIHNSSTGSGTPGPYNGNLGDSFAFIPTYNMSYTDGNALRTTLATKSAKVSFSNFSKRVQPGDDINTSSSRGPSTPNFDIKPDVSAPGTNIMSSVASYGKDYPGIDYSESYDRYTGTSMATPHVAGVVALLKSAHPNYTAFDLKVAVTNTAKQLDTAKYDVFSQGAGLVQPYKAVHTDALAYSLDKVTFSNNTYDNVKGTITYGNVPTGSANSITKDVKVKNLTGSPSDYNVSVQVTKAATGAFANAKVTVDKTSFTLNDEQLLKVTLSYPAGAGATGIELLGYVHITNGTTKMSLPFAANFAPPTGLKSYSIDSMHISPNGDGKLDSTTIKYEFYNRQGTTYLELWDAINQDAGYYEDGYLGYLVNSTSTTTGPKSVVFNGQYTPWGSAAGTKQLAPDGVYTLDLSTAQAAEYLGPIYIKSTPSTINAENTAVQGATATYTGSVTDSYVDWKDVVEEVFGEDYDVNDNLHVKYELYNAEGDLVDSQPITLAADGTFNMNLVGLTEGENKLKLIADDEAQNHAEKVVTITSSTPGPDPDPLPTVEPGQGLLLKGGKPLANLQFSLHSTGTEPVWYDMVTDANGIFTHNLPDGEYNVVGIWDAPNWYLLNKTFTLKDGLVNGAPVIIEAFDTQLPPADQWNVKGSVKNGTKPFSNLTFSVRTADSSEWYATTTDLRGDFVFNLPNGDYVVEGIWVDAHSKWYEMNQAFSVKEGKLDGATELAIDVKNAVNTANVTGKLTKGTKALANLVFSLRTSTGEPQWYAVQTDSNGRYEVKLPDGTYTIEGIWVGSEGKWYVLNKEFTVAGTLAMDIDVLQGPPEAAPNVTGLLTKAGAPLANLNFSIEDTTGNWFTTTTETDGSFNFKLADGTYKIHGIWNGSESKWYELNQLFTVKDGKLEGANSLTIELP